MKKILTVAAVMALGAAGYAISAANEKATEGTSTARPACCARKSGTKAAASTEAGAAICQKGAAAAATTAANQTRQGQEVTLAGKVLCEHCDLHVAEACAPALKAEGRDSYLRICPTSKDIQALRKAGDVEVKGYVRPGPDGRDEIEVISFNKRPEKT